MQRFKNILLVLDPETEELAALVRAVSLARQNRARLQVLVVLEHLQLDDLPLGTRTLIGHLDHDQLRDMIEHRQRVRLDEKLKALSSGDLDLRTSVAWSHTPFLTIIQEVLRSGHDLVIKDALQVTGPGALLHPTDRHLIRKCPCPTWMIRSKGHTTYRRVLAAVDLFPVDETNAELNRRILELAVSQASRDEAELHLVHAYRAAGGLLFSSVADSRAYAKAVAALRRERLDSLLAGYSIPGKRVHLEEGVPGEVIPAVASRERIDLIVMGTLARVGIPGLFIGNTAERTLDHVRCDVLTIKPRGFVTPVRLPDPA